MNKAFWGKKSVGEYFSLLSAIFSIICMIYTWLYMRSIDSVNITVILLLVISMICNIVYFGLDKDFPIDIGIFELVASVSTAFALAFFALGSWKYLADLLNGIKLFSGGKGNIQSIFTIIIMITTLEVVEIVICFMKKGRQSQKQKVCK